MTIAIIPTPSKVVGTYFQLYSGGMRITAVPTVVNLIYLFQAVPTSTGGVKFEYGNVVNAADIATCRGRGQRVVLTVGGANAGFSYKTQAQADAFVAGVKSVITSLGGVLDGVDYNFFEAGVTSTPSIVVNMSQQLKSFYGPNFSITCPPAPGAGYAPQDRVLTKALADAGVLTYAGPQFYDSSDLTTEAILMQLIPEWVTNNGGAEKVVLGVGANYSGGGTTVTTVNAWKKLIVTYPKLRGVFGWSAQDDANHSWSFSKTLATTVGAAVTPPPTGNTTPPPTGNTPPPTGATYTVVSGDTLNKISTKTGVSVTNLQKWNPIIVDINVLEIGWVLRLTAP